MDRVDYGLQRVAEVVRHHPSSLANRRHTGSIAQHRGSLLNQILQVFRSGPEFLLDLFPTVDIYEGHHCSLDLVIRGPVWSNPDQEPASLWTPHLELLVDVLVNHLFYSPFQIRCLEVKVDVEDGSTQIASFQIEQLI